MSSSVEWKGVFQLWTYSVSHGKLLLRSTRSADRDSQIDVLFVDVIYVSIPTVFNDLKLSWEGGGFDENHMVLADMDEKKNFKLTGIGCDGFVVAGGVTFCESDNEYYDQSPLIE